MDEPDKLRKLFRRHWPYQGELHVIEPFRCSVEAAPRQNTLNQRIAVLTKDQDDSKHI